MGLPALAIEENWLHASHHHRTHKFAVLTSLITASFLGVAALILLIVDGLSLAAGPGWLAFAFLAFRIGIGRS
jgi:hypothetical protein